ncbi:MAG: DUF2914 domain-containing protein [Candidatus Marinimicrobia bacterium]|nr:DUF2914 domain-containing protein [Candidatus Neomarinimicrobiota bacterium]
MNLFQDPTFIPITIIFLVLLLVALWQKLDRYILPLSIVYVVYAVYTAFTIDETIPVETVAQPVDDTYVAIDTNEEGIKPVEINNDFGEVHLQQDIVKVENKLLKPIPDLRVNSLLFCEFMIDSIRKPINIGNEFPITLEKVYCYSGIRNALGTRTILYEWYFEGKYIDTIPVKIDRSVHWRSWTYKTIKDAQVGQWYVVIRDEPTNTALDTAYFRIIDE